MSNRLQIILTTTLTLVDQFQSTLSLPSPTTTTTTTTTTANTSNPTAPKDPDPLPLLSVSTTALKSHVTKLSLLTINSPFAPTAVAATLSTLNESVLPSLVTAALLVTPETHTRSFQSELRVLTGTALKELSLLLKEVRGVADEKGGVPLSQADKDIVTVAAGRVWDACDVLVDVAAKGVVGFVIRRAEEYRDLVRDAVEEIEEWDPDEEGDEFFDELLGDEDDGNGDDTSDDAEEEEEGGKEEEDRAALHAQKKHTLRVLKPIAQIFPAIISNRLKKTPESLSNVKKLEALVLNLQHIPEHIDEVAGALYEADLEKSDQHLQKAREYASKAIDSVVMPWNVDETADGQRNTEDRFTAWSKTWTRVMEEVAKSTAVAPSSK